MKILITGASGFVGNNIARAAINRGFNVGLLLRNQFNQRTKDLTEKISVFNGCVLDREALKRIADDFNPDAVFHLATYGAYPRKQKDFDLMVDTNIRGTVNLIEVMDKIPVINTGSSSEYGLKDFPMKESDICRPNNSYGLTKLAQTLLCQQKGIPTLRIFSAYGPYEDEGRLVPTLINATFSDTEVNLVNSVKDYIYTEDIADAFFKTLERYDKIKGKVINLGSGQQINVRTITEIVEMIAGKPLKKTWNYSPAQNESSVWVADTTESRQLLDWAPKVDLNTGIERTYNWWKNV